MDLRSNNKIKVEGGMASMTDLVFLLLIFFIIMSLMSNNTMTVDVPKDSDLPQETKPVNVTVVITEDNGYVVKPGGDVNAPRAEFKDIVPELNAAMDESQDFTLRIEGHRLADYEAVFKVMAYADVQQWKPALAYKK
ncbi:biopolymer transporter ExbD [Crocinitomicaceae bacterium]|nr:biopolymer transporter ExbD [Crocinitomicaceae bacterium]